MAWRWRAFGAVAGGCCIADATFQVQQGCSSFVLRRARCGDSQNRASQDNDPGQYLLGVKREIAARDGSIVAAVDLVRQQLEENQKARLLLHGPAGAGRGAVVRLVAQGLQNLEDRQQQETTNKEEEKNKSEEQEGIKTPCLVYIDCSRERSFSWWATKGWSPRHFLYDLYWLGQVFSGGATMADEMVLDTVRGVDHATLILDRVSCLGMRQDALVQTALEDTSLRVLVNGKVDTVGDVERLYSCKEMIGVRIGDPVSDMAKASRLLALVEAAKTCRPNVYRDKTLEQVYQELTVQRENPREPTWGQESGAEPHLAPESPESPPKPRTSNDGSLVVSSLPRTPDAADLDDKSELEFEANFYEDLEFVLETSIGWRLEDTMSAMQALARTGSIQAAIHTMVDQEATRLENILRHQVRDDQIAAWLWSVLESLCGTAISMAGIEHAVKSAEGTKMTVLPDLIYVDEITDRPPPEQAPLSWLSHGILETKVSEAGTPLVFVRQLVKKAFDECTYERDAFVSAMDERIRAVYELQDTYWLGIDLKAYFARRERYEAAMEELSQLEAVSDDENEDIVIESKINLDSERLNLETLRADLLKRCAELYPDSIANQEIPKQENTMPRHA